MALYTTLASLSQTAASNAADGTADAPSTIDNQLNLLASFIAQLRDGSGFTGIGQGRLINVQTFTANGTYTPTTGTTSIIYELIAPGGGGGGAPATGAGQVSGGANGGAGGYTVGRATTGFSGATITIGAVGAGGVAGAAGGNGGTVSFGALATALGGSGAGVAAAAAVVNIDGFNGGVAGSGGNILAVPGNASALSSISAATGGGIAAGAPGPKGGAVRGQGVTGTGVTGLTATAYGAGGGGAANNVSQAARSGGAGGPGVVIIWEYA